MLPFREAVSRARDRERARLAKAADQKNPVAAGIALIQGNRPFHDQLIDALRRSRDDAAGPQSVPPSLYLALPERLFGRWFYLAYGQQRHSAPGSPTDTVDRNVETWKRWDPHGMTTKLRNFTAKKLRGIFVAHGLSPTADTTLLLADLGRAFRISRALELPIHVLLADVSWMSHNRSVRKLGFSDQELESGLMACLDRRLRLYSALGLTCKVHQILTYEKVGAIHEEKIRLIARRYEALIHLLWGPSFTDETKLLDKNQLAQLDRQLPDSLDENSSLRALAQFPGGLQGLDRALFPHLEIVRAVAKRFRTLTPDTFSYYFAQYYAQVGYRDWHLKVCPESELDFDEPFDDLDPCFKAWGEGHVPQIVVRTKLDRRRPLLAGIYLPQYRLADWAVLPYTPVSLDAVAHSGGKLQAIGENVILMTDADASARAKLYSIAERTLASDLTQWNRFCADLLSLLHLILKRHGRSTFDDMAEALGWKGLDHLVDSIVPGLSTSLAMEAEPETRWGDLWLTWLRSLEGEKGIGYTPSHILVAAMTDEDWVDMSKQASVDFVILINAVISRLLGIDTLASARGINEAPGLTGAENELGVQ
jgi:hypothetical protein